MKLLIRLNDIPQNCKVAIYGSGQAGLNFLTILHTFRKDVETLCFIDSVKSGQAGSLQIIPLNLFFQSQEEKQTLILIASIQWREIEGHLKNIQCNNYIVIPPHFLYPSGYRSLKANQEIDPCENPLSRPLFSPSDKKDYASLLNQVSNLLTNSREKELFGILTGLSLTPSDYIQQYVKAVANAYYYSSNKRQYFDFIDYSNIHTIIEGGVYDGADTAAFVKIIGEKGGSVFGFEPNISSYRESPYQKMLSSNSRVKISPIALWSHSTQLHFQQDGLSSGLSIPTTPNEPHSPKERMVIIDTQSIDQIKNIEKIEKVDFIKLDIEGAEVEALEGAIETLTTHRPQLAICIYHKKEHFFKIPIFLSGLLEGYEFHIAHYTANHLETVWYGIPLELR